MRPLQTLPLPANVISKLLGGGFLYCEDLFDNDQRINPEAKERLANLPKEMLMSLETVVGCPAPISALDVYHEEIKAEQIVSFSQSVDRVLGGGITLGEITELSGASGSGKTQLCLQICISVQVPKILGGVQGEAIYVDTNSGFSAPRMEGIARASYCKCVNAVQIQDLGIENLPADYTKWLDGVHYISIHNFENLIATINMMSEFLALKQKVKLIVIDSFNFPFLNMENTLARTQFVCRLVKKLASIAEEFNLAVVVVNQLTTKIIKQEAILQPALGDYYGHMIPKRFLLGYSPSNQTHSIAVYKSSSLPHFSAEFMVTENGIEDV